MKELLVVVDMQDEFENSQHVIDEVIQEVREAGKRNNPVVVLEFGGFGPTNQRVMREIRKLPKSSVLRMVKEEDDGSREVMRAAEKLGAPLENVRLCGVNLCYCVKATAVGLRNVAQNIEISDAVSCNCGGKNGMVCTDW